MALPAVSQVRRMCINNPLRGNRMVMMDVYEYDFVDVQPQFPGGERALMNYINQTREYPYHAYHNKIQGRVVCSFVVNIDGSISNVEVIKGVEESLNREAVRILGRMPEWTPGRINGQPVPTRVVWSVPFRK